MQTYINVQNAVLRFFAAIDAASWKEAEALMATPFHVDYSSFGAGPAADLAPADVLAGWRQLVPGFEATQHQLGPLSISMDDATARVSADVTGSHFLKSGEGSHHWTVFGRYEMELVDGPTGWQLRLLRLLYRAQTGDGDLPDLARQRVIDGLVRTAEPV